MINLIKRLTVYLNVKITAINKGCSLTITKAEINVHYIHSTAQVTATEHEATLDLEAITISWGGTQFSFRIHDFPLVI